MASPFGSFGKPNVFFALPTHRVKEQDAKRRNDPAVAGRERPERRGRAFAGDNAGCIEPPELDKRHQGYGTIRAAAGRVEVDGAFTARVDPQESIGQLG